MGSSLSSAILILLFAFCLSLPTLSLATELKAVDIKNPVLEVIPAPLSEHSAVPGSKDVLFCERARVSGTSRLKLGSYASSLKITLSTSLVIPERLHSKTQVCFHRNNTLGLCQCVEDDWKILQKGLWISVMSPYDDRYVDVKFIGKIPGSVTITVEEDFQRWRLVCLALGFTLLLFAPIVSNWVPFYYSSSMVIGGFLVIIIILFQGMKLLPTGRKNVLYLTIYGSVLGAGSFLVPQFSLMVNSVLLSFGLSEEMHNPVSIFLLVGIIPAGAALGYWIVREFVVSKDGTVDVGVAQFVKWAMRIIGTTSILQSTLDTPLAMGALVSYWIIMKLITSLKWHRKSHQSDAGSGSPWLQNGEQVKGRQSRPGFLSRSLSAWSDSPVKDSKYAQDLQFQEALMSSSAITSQSTHNGGSSSSSSSATIQATQAIQSNPPQPSTQILCEICVEMKEADEFFQNEGCVHSFCSDCITNHVASKIQANIHVILCPGLDCRAVLELDACMPILPKEVIEGWNDALCEAMVLGAQRLYCPFSDCSTVLMIDNEGEEAVRVSECPICHRLFCARCQVPWHPGVDCEEYRKLNEDERGRADLMVKELAKQNKWKRCPRCKYYVEKTQGCLHITCRCQYQFCYGCGAEWTSTHGGCQ
ncbi:uncharacterized protein LOC103955106 isoform X2 [Pyrus x bretschneideri]|uniref:uncharacterized protein LOC103955106 isoform X2 n=1 Tax=Pyrus x bretschneideri TaxID=225117 RepID=UPI00202ECDE5|nr:uncharacterized protein LOC103955106 isoform X2 [Pyrus x bretschneideri]